MNIQQQTNKWKAEVEDEDTSRLKLITSSEEDYKFVCTRRYYLSQPCGNIYLTPQETVTVLTLFEHNRIKKIARIMDIAVRTVEFYLQNTRDKFNCSKKKKLIELLQQIGFFEQYKLIDGKIFKKKTEKN